MKLTKKRKSLIDNFDLDKQYELIEAINLIKENAVAKFDESVDVAVNLGIDAKKSDQMVRGSVVLPNGTGKKVKVAVFAQGKNIDEAKKAGADIIGHQDLAEKIKSGIIDFDLIIASPDTMPVVGQLGQILGPKGLMPNPKVGTVTQNVSEAVKNAKNGQVTFKTDKTGIVHCSIGKASFSSDKLKENIKSLVSALIKLKPTGSKGAFVRKLSLSSTMGIGVKIDFSSLEK